jgi:hypothetical protein
MPVDDGAVVSVCHGVDRVLFADVLFLTSMYTWTFPHCCHDRSFSMCVSGVACSIVHNKIQLFPHERAPLPASGRGKVMDIDDNVLPRISEEGREANMLRRIRGRSIHWVDITQA